MTDDARLAEIVAKARTIRKPLPRWLWSTALAIGAACLGAFVWMMLQPAGTPSTPAQHHVDGPGFPSGLVIGGLAGFLVGWAAQRGSSRKSP